MPKISHFCCIAATVEVQNTNRHCVQQSGCSSCKLPPSARRQIHPY